MIKVSVVLTTYNGEKYLQDLLDSLRMQTYTIDEVLICDDGSTDDTPKKVAKYIEKFQLGNWKIIVNQFNKGWKRNFRDGILMAKGNFIFPCDQDDVWEKNKIERMVSVMTENEKIMLLASDYQPIYEMGGQKVEKPVANFHKLEKIPFDNHFALGNRPGCVMCIRRSLIDIVHSIWEDWYPHDAFLWTAAIFMNGCYILHEPLIRYRRHSDNTTNHETRDKQAVILSLKRNSNLINSSLIQSKMTLSEKEGQIVDRYIQYAKLRIELLEKKKLVNILKLIRYRGFYRTVKQQLGDLYLVAQ